MHKDTTRRSGESSLLASTALLLTALAMGCAMEEPISGSEPQIEASEATILAEVITGDGVEYTFLSTQAGDVGVAVMAPDPVDSMPLPGPDSSLVDLYQSISGQPAPEALVVAERRAGALARSSEEPAGVEERSSQLSPGDPVDARSDELPEGAAAPVQALTASEFASMFCKGEYDFLYCWPNTTGNPWVQRTASYFAVAVATTTCRVRLRFRVYRQGAWTTIRDTSIQPGHFYWFSMQGMKIPRRVEVIGNEGCVIRFAAWGNI